MKKFFMFAIAALAISITSCKNNANNAPAEEPVIDSIAVMTEEATKSADEAIAKIAENIEKKDASAIQTAIETVKAKAAELLATNPDIAKEYLAKVQTYLKENAEAVKAVVGNNAAVATVISSITEAPVDDVVSSLSSALSAGQEKVEDLKDAANSAKEAVENAPEALKEKGQEVVDKAKEEAGKKVDEAAQKGVDAVKKGLGI